MKKTTKTAKTTKNVPVNTKVKTGYIYGDQWWPPHHAWGGPI